LFILLAGAQVVLSVILLIRHNRRKYIMFSIIALLDIAMSYQLWVNVLY